MTFSQIDATAKLVQTIARMDIPNDDTMDDDAMLRAIDDAATLYTLIHEARDILRSKTR